MDRTTYDCTMYELELNHFYVIDLLYDCTIYGHDLDHIYVINLSYDKWTLRENFNIIDLT